MKRMKRYFEIKKMIAFAIVFCAISLIGCEKYVIKPTEIDPTKTLYFATDINPIFSKNNCASCHSGSIAPDLRADKSYNSLTTGGFVNVADPESSKLYMQLVNKSSHQPKTTVDEETYILYWITQGAKNN
jgi:hypothetical protein